MADVRRVAACAYMAALYELWGRINIHEYAERDGRWYLDVTIKEPWPAGLPFQFMKKEFGGRVITITTKDATDVVVWRAVGPRAYDVLTSIGPYVLGNRSNLDHAVRVFGDVMEAEDDEYDDEYEDDEDDEDE